MKINRLVLASTSPHRRLLLEQAGIYVAIAEPQADEAQIAHAGATELAQARSELKGLSLAPAAEPYLAIAGDQVLEFAGLTFGKAHSEDEARERLQTFSGHTHYLRSAYSLILYAAEPRLLLSRVVSATMHMRKLSPEEIDAYLATGEWRGCAGCYQYENKGVQLFSSVEGELSTIVGLPVRHLLQDLRSLGINPLLTPQGPWSLS